MNDKTATPETPEIDYTALIQALERYIECRKEFPKYTKTFLPETIFGKPIPACFLPYPGGKKIDAAKMLIAILKDEKKPWDLTSAHRGALTEKGSNLSKAIENEIQALDFKSVNTFLNLWVEDGWERVPGLSIKKITYHFAGKKYSAARKDAINKSPGVSEDLTEETGYLRALSENGGHPNVLQLIYAYRDVEYNQNAIIRFDTPLYGMDLKQFIANGIEAGKSPITITPKIWCLLIAKALQYIHGKNIIHVDLKPENILISLKDPENLQPIIADFGISKPKGTKTIGYAGTTGYIDPAMLDIYTFNCQTKNKSGYQKYIIDEHTDTYSAALVMWCILTGTPDVFMKPNPALHPGQWSDQVKDFTMQPSGRPPLQAGRNIAGEIDAEQAGVLQPYAELLSNMWNAEPKNRPITNEVVTALEAIEGKGCT